MPPASAMLMGKSMDVAVNFNYEHKIKTGKDEKVSAVKDCFNDTFKEGIEETVFDEGQDANALKDKGILTTAVFHKEICKKVKPAAVQIAEEISFKNVDYTLKVIVDLLTADEVIVDNKYTGRTWPEGKEFGELDPVIYSLWYKQKYGKNSGGGFRFDIGIGNKIPKTDQRTVIVTDDNIAGFLKYLAAIYDDIEHSKRRGIFLPRTDNFLCSRRKCGYYKKCEAEFKIRIKD